MFPELDQPFANRREAGAELAAKLKPYAGRDDVVVLALPRGGVPVAFEIADALDAALDIFLVRKLGMPGHREYAMGAIASGGVRVLSEEAVRVYRVPAHAIEAIAREEQATSLRRRMTRSGHCSVSMRTDYAWEDVDREPCSARRFPPGRKA